MFVINSSCPHSRSPGDSRNIMVIWFSARVLNYFSGSEENISGKKGKRELSSDQLLNEVENYSIVKAIGTEREKPFHICDNSHLMKLKWNWRETAYDNVIYKCKQTPAITLSTTLTHSHARTHTHFISSFHSCTLFLILSLSHTLFLSLTHTPIHVFSHTHTLRFVRWNLSPNWRNKLLKFSKFSARYFFRCGTVSLVKRLNFWQFE